MTASEIDGDFALRVDQLGAVSAEDGSGGIDEIRRRPETDTEREACLLTCLGRLQMCLIGPRLGAGGVLRAGWEHFDDVKAGVFLQRLIRPQGPLY